MTGHSSGTPRLVAAVAAAAVAALTATLLGLTQLELVNPSLAVRAAAVAVSALLAFVSTTLGAVAAWRRRRDAALHERVSFVLRSVAYTVQDLTDLDTRELGLALYLLRADRWPPGAALANLLGALLPGRRADRLRLVRVVRERASRRPTASGVIWRPGKGVIGLCVSTGEVVGQDVAALTGAWRAVPRERWQAVPESVRDGFSWGEFRSLAGKYGSVLAAPLIQDAATGSEVIGCVSLDGPDSSFGLLWTPDVRSALAQAADTLRVLVL